MTQNEPRKPIFEAFFTGQAQFPYKTITTNANNRYVGFFIGESGDKWIFIYDPDLGGGIITGNDIGWDIITLGDGDIPINDTLVLRTDETRWLESCWTASAYLRNGNESGVPKDYVTIEKAASHWSIRESVLRSDVTANRLKAIQMGNVWITTGKAMANLYGGPIESKQHHIETMSRLYGESLESREYILEIIKESELLHKQDIAPIREKLMDQQD